MSDNYDIVKILLFHISAITGKPIRSIDDLLVLDTEGLLELTERLDDAILPLFITIFKSSLKGRELFHKLTGELDEKTHERAKAFLCRYMDLILQQEERNDYYNPLLAYLPTEGFDDLAFIQSRQPFFLRQAIEAINEFLIETCGCGETFNPGQQEEAWGWFWNYLLKN